MWEQLAALFIGTLGFAFQTLIIVIALIVLIGFIVGLASKNKEASPIKITPLNRTFKKYQRSLEKHLLDKKDLKKQNKDDGKKAQAELLKKPRAFLVNFVGDMKASSVDSLRKEITAILLVAKPTDQVIVNVESPGGVVHGYGLAASQLQRVRDHKIPLTVCVDKVAASGGYMMASVADKILSAPFAIIGSIGVVASMPNFNKLLEKNNVDYHEITAGEYKRTLTPLGKVTDQGLDKFKEQIEDIHILFKNHVQTSRPQVDISKVATGEYWFGLRAKELNLVDEIKTSDEYLIEIVKSHQLLQVQDKPKKSLKEKLAGNAEETLSKAFQRFYEKGLQIPFF